MHAVLQEFQVTRKGYYDDLGLEAIRGGRLNAGYTIFLAPMLMIRIVPFQSNTVASIDETEYWYGDNIYIPDRWVSSG
jgi:hypothetical protein